MKFEHTPKNPEKNIPFKEAEMILEEVKQKIGAESNLGNIGIVSQDILAIVDRNVQKDETLFGTDYAKEVAGNLLDALEKQNLITSDFEKNKEITAATIEYLQSVLDEGKLEEAA
ncbi:MAG: hypothetical protein AAB432_02920 [Patescibacteria group bacterium]